MHVGVFIYILEYLTPHKFTNFTVVIDDVKLSTSWTAELDGRAGRAAIVKVVKRWKVFPSDSGVADVRYDAYLTFQTQNTDRYSWYNAANIGGITTTLFVCEKCGKNFNSYSAKDPRCTDPHCSSTRVHAVEMTGAAAELGDYIYKNQLKTDTQRQTTMDTAMEKLIETIDERIKKQSFNDEFDAELVKIARRMGKIYALNALAQGKMLDAEGQHAGIISDVMTSLKESNENMANALADVQSQDIEATSEQISKENDPIKQILDFASKNPDAVKEFMNSFKKTD